MNPRWIKESGSAKQAIMSATPNKIHVHTRTNYFVVKYVYNYEKNFLTTFLWDGLQNLLESLTLKENIALPLILDKMPPQKIENRVNELMSFFAISDLKEKYPYHASGGQKQRVAAARALSIDPAVIFADEPTGNLDSKSSANIMEMMTQMNIQKHCTILMVTHDAFAASYCQKIIFIKDGKIYMQIQSSGDRKAFFDKILETLSIVGGEKE